MATAMRSINASRFQLSAARRSVAPRGARMTVRAEAPETPIEAPAAPAMQEVPVAAPAPVPTPVAAPAPSFGSAMAFAGAGPETINGRLAMLGFVSALGAELATGKGVLSQLDGNIAPIAATFVLFSVASLVPILKGAKMEAFGPLTPKAEALNGQVAMIGFAFLLLIEAINNGTALF